MGNSHSSTDRPTPEDGTDLLQEFRHPRQRPLKEELADSATRMPQSVAERPLLLPDSAKTNELDPPAYDAASFLIRDYSSLKQELMTVQAKFASHFLAVLELQVAVYQSGGEDWAPSADRKFSMVISTVDTKISYLRNSLIPVRPALVPGHRQNLLGGATALVEQLRDLGDGIEEYVADLTMAMFGPQRCAINEQERVLEAMREKRDGLQVRCCDMIRQIYAFRLSLGDSLKGSR